MRTNVLACSVHATTCRATSGLLRYFASRAVRVRRVRSGHRCLLLQTRSRIFLKGKMGELQKYTLHSLLAMINCVMTSERCVVNEDIARFLVRKEPCHVLLEKRHIQLEICAIMRSNAL